MVHRKQKKVTKYRGSKTHGGGSMKKRRGAGHRGGRGRAGSGKRGDAKKPRYWREEAEKGFTSKSGSQITAINVGHLSSAAATLVAAGKASEKAGVISIDLKDLGYNRLLGGGVVTQKLSVTVDSATGRAEEKVSAAGGSVVTENTEAKAE